LVPPASLSLSLWHHIITRQTPDPRRIFLAIFAKLFKLSSAVIDRLAKEQTPMSIEIEHLRGFQSRELEQPNMQTNARQPVFTKTIEWSLIEIVILLTEIRDSINSVANKP
jgi:hypothetical protein